MTDMKDTDMQSHHYQDSGSTFNQSNHVEQANSATSLSEAHQKYLIERHGTTSLDPTPDFSDADPFNWSKSKKVVNLLLVAFHAMMSTFTASCIQSAFPQVAEDLGVGLQRTTYLSSLCIAVLGGAPLFWQPISQRYGRRPIFLISLLCSAAGNIGCAKSPDFGSMAACRAITSFFISPALALGSAVVKETFFKNDRARYMGVWTLMVTLGVPVAPFIFGFVAQRTSYRWIYWTLAITNGVQLVLYFFFGPETRYIRSIDDSFSNPTNTTTTTSTFKQQYLTLRRIDPTPITAWSFLSPLALIRHPRVIIAAVAHSMVFLFASVLTTVEIAALFGQKFAFGPQQLGLQFLGPIIGTIIGELISALTSDRWMAAAAKRRNNVRPAPEFRLWLSYAAYALSICGVVVFLVQIEKAAPLHWNVSPIVGAAIAAVGNQIATTVLITYAVDCYSEEAASVGVFITFVRQIWGFIGPFWFTPMFQNCGLYISAVIASVLILSCSVAPTVALQMNGFWSRRRKQSS